MSYRDSWERLVGAVLKREQYLQLCYKEESTSLSSDSFSSDFTLNHNLESFSQSPVKILEIPRVRKTAGAATSITHKLLSVLQLRRKAKDKQWVDLPDDIAIQLRQLRRFSLVELRDATQNFNARSIIQHAGNNVYKCSLADGSIVAVKRFKYRGGSNQESEFRNDVIINTITKHPNLLGYCIAPKERLLVFRLMVGDHIPFSGLRGKLEEFSWQELLKLTDNFSEKFEIGRTTSGSVYHAALDDGRHVAISRYENTDSLSELERGKSNEFLNGIKFLSLLNHKNVIPLLGYCNNSNERVLVYPYMENGNLFHHLHNLESSPLVVSWPMRIKVALDVARGIEYLHEYAVPHVIHRDIKSSNILLDETWTSKLADFGVSLMGPQDDEPHLQLVVADTCGYVDPEYYRTNMWTTKSDVYSFGVVLLELMSGCKVIHKNEDGVQMSVVDYVDSCIIRDELHRVLDPRVPPLTPAKAEGLAYMGCLACNCVISEGQHRPTMSYAVNILEKAFAVCHEF